MNFKIKITNHKIDNKSELINISLKSINLIFKIHNSLLYSKFFNANQYN